MKCVMVGEAGQGPEAGWFLSNKENKLSQVADSFHRDPSMQGFMALF